MTIPLDLKCAKDLSEHWIEDEYAVIANTVEIGRLFKTAGMPWMWWIHHPFCTGFEATREAAMAAFAKSWRRQ